MLLVNVRARRYKHTSMSESSKQHELEHQIARLVRSCDEEAKKWKFEEAMGRRPGRTVAPLVPNLDKMAKRREQCNDTMLSIPALPAAVVTADLLEEEVKVNGKPRNDPQSTGRQALEFYNMRKQWLHRERQLCLDRWADYCTVDACNKHARNEGSNTGSAAGTLGTSSHSDAVDHAGMARAVIEVVAELSDAHADASTRAARLARGKVHTLLLFIFRIITIS